MDDKTRSRYLSDVDYFSRRLEVQPDTRLFMPLAVAYHKLGNLDDAIAICRHGLQHHPDYLGAKTLLAQAYLEKGYIEEAKGLLIEVTYLNRSNYRAHKALGTIYRSEGMYDIALKHLKMALAVVPADKALQQAVQELEQAVSSGDTSNVSTATAAMGVKMGERKAALPPRPETQGQASEVVVDLLANGDYETARRYMDEYFTPEDDFYRDIMQQIVDLEALQSNQDQIFAEAGEGTELTEDDLEKFRHGFGDDDDDDDESGAGGDILASLGGGGDMTGGDDLLSDDDIAKAMAAHEAEMKSAAGGGGEEPGAFDITSLPMQEGQDDDDGFDLGSDAPASEDAPVFDPSALDMQEDGGGLDLGGDEPAPEDAPVFDPSALSMQEEESGPAGFGDMDDIQVPDDFSLDDDAPAESPPADDMNLGTDEFSLDTDAGLSLPDSDDTVDAMADAVSGVDSIGWDGDQPVEGTMLPEEPETDEGFGGLDEADEPDGFGEPETGDAPEAFGDADGLDEPVGELVDGDIPDFAMDDDDDVPAPELAEEPLTPAPSADDDDDDDLAFMDMLDTGPVQEEAPAADAAADAFGGHGAFEEPEPFADAPASVDEPVFADEAEPLGEPEPVDEPESHDEPIPSEPDTREDNGMVFPEGPSADDLLNVSPSGFGALDEDEPLDAASALADFDVQREPGEGDAAVESDIEPEAPVADDFDMPEAPVADEAAQAEDDFAMDEAPLAEPVADESDEDQLTDLFDGESEPMGPDDAVSEGIAGEFGAMEDMMSDAFDRAEDDGVETAFGDDDFDEAVPEEAAAPEESFDQEEPAEQEESVESEAALEPEESMEPVLDPVVQAQIDRLEQSLEQIRQAKRRRSGQ